MGRIFSGLFLVVAIAAAQFCQHYPIAFAEEVNALPTPTNSEQKRDLPPTKSAQEVIHLFELGLQLLKANRAYEARQYLSKAAMLNPNSAGIHCNLGLAYQNSGNLNQALKEFQQALKLESNMPEATLDLAGCYQSLGQFTEAISWFEKYLSLNPKPADASQVRDILSAVKTIGQKPGANRLLPDYLLSVTADGTYRWPPNKLPIKVFIATGEGVERFRSNYRQLLIKAFNNWIAASGGKLSYLVVPDQSEADINCNWTSNPKDVSTVGTESERGVADIVANSKNEIQRASIKLLTVPILEDSVVSDDEIEKTCLHEVGHALGLQGHSTNNHDVMFFTIDTSTVWQVLTKRDKATIAKLYEQYDTTQQQVDEIPIKTSPQFSIPEDCP